MAVTTDEYNRILNRLSALESFCNDLAVAQSTLITLTQVNQLVVTLSSQIQALSIRVDANEDRITDLENQPA